MQTNLYFKRFHYHIILSIFNAMMESFVAFAKIYIYIYIICQTKEYFYVLFFWNCEKFGSLWKISRTLRDFDNKSLYSLEVADVLSFRINNARFIFCDRNRQYTHSAKPIITPIKTRHRLPECILQHPGLPIIRRRRNIVPWKIS